MKNFLPNEARDIEFRFWSTKEKRMIDNPSLHGNRGLKEFFNLLYSEGFISLQYIGLKDKKGQKIFEGDIVVSERHAGFAEISYFNSSFHASSEMGDWTTIILDENSGASEFNEIDCDDLIVIGNIFQDGYLLKNNDDE